MRDKDIKDIVLEVLEEILKVTVYEQKKESYGWTDDWDKPKILSFQEKLEIFISLQKEK